jgi:serine/threonine protein kinase
MIKTIIEIEHIKDFEEQGFYSKTYLANDKRLGREVAVKDIIYENLTSEGDFEKYFDEAFKLSTASHPRVLPVYYVGLDHEDGTSVVTPRIVTCYFGNGSLNAYLQKLHLAHRTIDLDEAIRFAHDIIQGMNHLHSLDILHLDLKASNIYIGDDMKLVIGDFGQSKFIKDGIVLDLGNIYPAIAPLEYSKSRSVDKTADIYQFGLLLYSMVCYKQYREAIDNQYKINTQQLTSMFRDKLENSEELKAEFKLNMKKYVTDIKSKNFPSRTDYPYYVHSSIQEIIHKCLENEISKRYNNFYEIQTDLNKLVFPKGVTNLYQDLNTNEIHFTKEEKPCVISVITTADKFEFNAKKNGKKPVKSAKKEGVTQTKFSKSLFEQLNEI